MANHVQSDDVPLKSDEWIDEDLAPLAVFVDALSVASMAAISGSEYMPSMWVERLEIELPFEMDVTVDGSGRVGLAGGPPTQYTETTFMPVFHMVKLAVSGETQRGGHAESKLAS